MNGIFKRNCPKCNKEIPCKSVKYLNYSNKHNSLCHSCAFTGRERPPEYRQKIKNSLIGRKLPDKHKLNIKMALQNMSDEKKQEMSIKISLKHKGVPSHRRGKILNKEWRMKIRHGLLNMSPELKQKVIDGNKKRIISDESRRKMRLSRINYIEKIKFLGSKMQPRFSIKACQYFDLLNKQMGWNLQHGLSGGEYFIKDLGYWIDAYDKDRNIVIEYDEGYHNTIKDKDLRRMNEIKNLLECQFYRYDSISDELRKY